jgi:hypothetical protein
MGLFELEAARMRLNVGNPAAEFRPATGLNSAARLSNSGWLQASMEILSCNEYPLP